MINRFADGGATEADGGASAPLGPTVATPVMTNNISYAYYGIILCYNNHNVFILFLHVYLITPDGYTVGKLLS